MEKFELFVCFILAVLILIRVPNQRPNPSCDVIDENPLIISILIPIFFGLFLTVEIYKNLRH